MGVFKFNKFKYSLNNVSNGVWNVTKLVSDGAYNSSKLAGMLNTQSYKSQICKSMFDYKHHALHIKHHSNFLSQIYPSQRHRIWRGMKQ